MTIRSNAKGRHRPWEFEWSSQAEAEYLSMRAHRLHLFLRRFAWLLPFVMLAFHIKDSLLLRLPGDQQDIARLVLIAGSSLLWSLCFLPSAKRHALTIAIGMILLAQSGLAFLNAHLPNGIIEGMPALMLLPIFLAAMLPRRDWAKVWLPLCFVPNLCLAVFAAQTAGEITHVLGWSAVCAVAAFVVFRFGDQVFRQNYQLATELKQLAFRDPLTGLHNRRAFFSDPSVAQLPRASSGSVVYCDIDFFKKINDERGHEEGDRVLQQFAELLRAFLGERPQLQAAIAARIGGEEFALWLPEQDLIQAAQLAEELRQAVETLGFTASFGVAPVMGAEDIDVGLRRADLALYHAKAHGRNRVETAN